MKKQLIFALFGITAFLICDIAVAHGGEQYQAEVSAFYSRADEKSDIRTTSTGASAEVYFAPVNTEEHPYAEAAFLERIGSIVITAEEQESRSGWVRNDGSSAGLGINLLQLGFPLTAQIMHTSLRVISPVGISAHSDTYEVKVGNYFTNTFWAGVEYSYESREASFDILPSDTVRYKDYGLFAKYVYELGDYKELSFEATVGRNTGGKTTIIRNTDESISVDYFFDKSLSIGIGFQNSSGTSYNPLVKYELLSLTFQHDA